MQESQLNRAARSRSSSMAECCRRNQKRQLFAIFSPGIPVHGTMIIVPPPQLSHSSASRQRRHERRHCCALSHARIHLRRKHTQQPGAVHVGFGHYGVARSASGKVCLSDSANGGVIFNSQGRTTVTVYFPAATWYALSGTQAEGTTVTGPTTQTLSAPTTANVNSYIRFVLREALS